MIISKFQFEIRFLPRSLYGITPNLLSCLGAGKSSLFQSIFRLVDRSTIDGEIFIDDIDISRITLNHLRSHISVIPQQPVLFSGTLRYNLDPFNHYSDEQCWKALEAVQLKEMAFKQEAGLLLPVAESGSNLSVGQCQLICVARAILKQSKILLIDEATANVDQETDRLLQAVIAEKFRDRTVLTIAHRLNTVAGSDRLLVLNNGIVANFDRCENILPQYQ
jgi:ABC-type multidrug transport system fused ATPase/permease subunit